MVLDCIIQQAAIEEHLADEIYAGDAQRRPASGLSGRSPKRRRQGRMARSQVQLRQFMCDHKELKHLNQLANLVIYLQMMTHLFELNKLQHWTQSSTRQKLIADINGFKWILRFASCSGPCMSILDIQPQQQCRESCDVRGQSGSRPEPLDLWPVTLAVNRSGRNVPKPVRMPSAYVFNQHILPTPSTPRTAKAKV